eukprot:9776670-Alexandrium_andersonii.AAC.1
MTSLSRSAAQPQRAGATTRRKRRCMRGWRKSLRAVGTADERLPLFFTTQPRSATPHAKKSRTI